MPRRVPAAVLVVALAWIAGCRRPGHETLLTYFNGDFGLSVQYPASWKTEQAEQDGMWYRYFLGPPTGPQRKPAVSVTLLAGPLGMKLEDYAQTYLAGNNVAVALTQAMRCRPALRTLVVCRPLGSALAPAICCSTSALSMPTDSNEAACHALRIAG